MTSSRAIIVVLAVAMLTGCSASDSDSDSRPSLLQIAESARDQGHDWQAELLSDGDITLAEFDEGHRRTLACLEAAGIDFTEPQRNIPDGYQWIYDMTWPTLDDAAGQRVVEGCVDEHQADLALAMSAWGDWVTEPALLAATVECVSRSGFDGGPSITNLRDLWLAGASDGLTRQTVATCAQTQMERLHPGIAYAISF